MSISVLERPMYSEAEAARLLNLNQGTLHYWLEGGVNRGVVYGPVIRVEPQGGHPAVTWAEFVEAGMLRTYRRHHAVPLHELRAFISVLRERLGVPYPLADQRPFVVDNGQLVIEAQDQAGLDSEWRLVEHVSGVTSLLPQAQAFLRRVEWDGNVPIRWHPADDMDSPVVIDPERRFGRPTVGGVSTAVLWEQVKAGVDPVDVAGGYDVSESDVEWAVKYEDQRQLAA